LRQLTTHPANDEMPAWSADGRRVFFQSVRGRVTQIYSIDIAIGGPAEHHVASGFSYQFPKPSPQNGRLTFGSPDQDGNPEIYIEVDGQAWRVTDAGSDEKIPIWSPFFVKRICAVLNPRVGRDTTVVANLLLQRRDIDANDCICKKHKSALRRRRTRQPTTN
jgi:dipeptidyl aminopeptidase/acylaminoacyl peptidase